MRQDNQLIVSLSDEQLQGINAWARAHRERRKPGWGAMRAALRAATTVEAKRAIRKAFREKTQEAAKQRAGGRP